MTEKTQHIEHHATICSAIEADPALAAARRDRAAARAARERRPDASGPDPRAARESGDPAGATGRVIARRSCGGSRGRRPIM